MIEYKAAIRKAALDFAVGKIGAIEFHDRLEQAFQCLQLDQSSALADWIVTATNQD